MRHRTGGTARVESGCVHFGHHTDAPEPLILQLQLERENTWLH
jgi:hypothetical protein